MDTNHSVFCCFFISRNINQCQLESLPPAALPNSGDFKFPFESDGGSARGSEDEDGDNGDDDDDEKFEDDGDDAEPLLKKLVILLPAPSITLQELTCKTA